MHDIVGTLLTKWACCCICTLVGSKESSIICSSGAHSGCLLPSNISTHTSHLITRIRLRLEVQDVITNRPDIPRVCFLGNISSGVVVSFSEGASYNCMRLPSSRLTLPPFLSLSLSIYIYIYIPIYAHILQTIMRYTVGI